MCGDSAGLITPLCGNGMAIAIHSAKLLSDLICKIKMSEKMNMKVRMGLEENYQKVWDENFRRRLKWGRRIQTIFGRPLMTGIGVRSIHFIPPLERWLISKTHGKPLKD